MGKKLVLVVDDDKLVRRCLNMNLTREGVEVVEAENGEEGYTKFEKLSPKIIILDIKMPVLDGYSMAKRIREVHPESKTRIIGLTGYPAIRS